MEPTALQALAASGDPLLGELSPEECQVLAPFFEKRAYEPNEVVVREGDLERVMHCVLSGTARITRRGFDLGEVGAAGHFGELGLVAGRPRAASVVAVTHLETASLGYERWQGLAEASPALALGLLQRILGGVAEQLVEMTDSVGLLLQERSLPRRASVTVKIGDRSVQVRTGTPFDSLLPGEIDGKLVVAALVDRKAVALSAPVSSDSSVEPLTIAHWEGQRIYRQSQALLLLEAARRVGVTVSMGHSVGFARRVYARVPPPPGFAAELERQMGLMVEEDVPLREELWTLDEARAHFLRADAKELAALLDTWREQAVRLISYGEAYALRLGPVLPTTGRIGRTFRVLSDGDDLLLVHATGNDHPDELAERARVVARHVRDMTHIEERWLEALNVTSVGDFNHGCVGGDVSQLIRVSEGFQEKSIGIIADQIRDRGHDVKIVSIAGPSSAGKTTFIKRLSVQLQVNGITPVQLSLDDYYVNRDQTPKSPDGELDYEALEALHVDLLQHQLQKLLSGSRVATARYDFASGQSLPEGGREVALGAHDILMLEGIHGLNPELLSRLPEGSVYRIFVCPLAQLPFDRLTRVHASDVRLLRRIVRDRHTRGATAAMNIKRWPSVRNGERKHIFPYQHHADAVFDSSLIYELGVLKVFAERYLLEVPQSDPAYTTAFRLLGLLDRFVTIYPDHVPPTSILREFIGGSGFEY